VKIYIVKIIWVCAILFGATTLLGLSGCGKKGPLYLEKSPQVAPQQVDSPAATKAAKAPKTKLTHK